MPRREFPEHPLVGVGGVVVDAEARVLLIQRGSEPGRGRWSIPGGLVELGESLWEAVKREVAEETGLIVEPQGLVEVVDRIYREDGLRDSRVQYHYVVVDYWCRVLSGLAKPLSDAVNVAWLSREEWIDSNPYGLELITAQVIEKGWQMARTPRNATAPRTEQQ